MTQPTFWQKIRRATAGFVGALFLFTTVTTPVVEANFWEQRRDASRRVSGKSQGVVTVVNKNNTPTNPAVARRIFCQKVGCVIGPSSPKFVPPG
jgi:hypothetical protein